MEKNLFVKGELLEILLGIDSKNESKKEEIKNSVNKITESVCLGCTVYFEVRQRIGNLEYYLFNTENCWHEKISAEIYLKAKELYKNPTGTNNIPTLNLEPFYDRFPKVRESKSIGKGVEYLNRYLSSRLFNNSEKLNEALFKFLFVHKYDSQQLILNDRITDPDELIIAIEKALGSISELEDEKPYEEFKHQLQEVGFEPGLGRNAGRIKRKPESIKRIAAFTRS